MAVADMIEDVAPPRDELPDRKCVKCFFRNVGLPNCEWMRSPSSV